MKLDRQICERARNTRDPSYDGRFFVAIESTGIFCRPVCPAPLPRPENMRFYPTAAAAADAGYRPCLRCRPETAPGSPEWLGAQDLVRRAMIRIKDGYLNDRSVPRLAASMNISERKLRRQFKKYLGTSPVAMGNMHRVFFAKKLLTETRLSITRIALASGFGSIRQCNEMFRKIYQSTPSDIRRRQATGDRSNDAGATLRLDFRPPYDWHRVITFLAKRAVAGMEWAGEGAYARSIRVGDGQGWMSVRREPDKNRLALTISMNKVDGLMQVVNRVRRLFSLDMDMGPVHDLFYEDIHLKPLVQRLAGLRMPGSWDPFEFAVRAVIGQQVSVAAATTVAGRVAAKYGRELDMDPPPELRLMFPTPDELADADFNGLGLPRTRAGTLVQLVRALNDGRLSLHPAQDLDTFLSDMTRIPGIGPWTANYVAMRGLGHPDAFPDSDLGILKALAQNGVRPTPRQARKIAEKWRPWRASAAMLLWHHDLPAD